MTPPDSTATSAVPTGALNHLRRVIFMGSPGAGKRTQGAALAQQLGIPPLSPGELFRNLISDSTPLAARLRDVVAYGGYVDDETTNAAVDQRLSAPECRDGFLLYGYPRTLNQLQHLDEILGQRHASIDAVVRFDVPDEELVKRLLLREEQLGRIGDQADTIRARLALYHERTEPLIDVYAERGVVAAVDATGSFDEVKERIGAALHGLQRP